MKNLRRLASLCVVLCAIVSRGIFAQSSGTTTADLKGRVVDDKGLPLPGVTVTATNTETGQSRMTVSRVEGDYVISLLNPGVYSVKADVSLFTPAQFDNVRLSLGTTTGLDFTMRVAQTSEIITVTAEAPLIDPAKTDLSATVDRTRIEQLPNVQRNFLSFSLTTPRVTEDRSPQTGAAANSGFVINGQSPRYNNLVVDGFDNNDQATGGVRGTFSQDAVQEYQVITNPYASEYGRTASGVVNIITRSGTNDFKGSAFYFYRSDGLASADPLTGEKIPLKDHQFGASIGGPLVKDRTFFFAAYERQTKDTANAVSITEATATAIRAKGFVIETGNVPYDVRNDSFVLKLDHQLTTSNYATLRGSYSKGLDENQQQWGGLVARTAGGARDSRDVSGALAFTSIIGAHSFNELRGLYSDAKYETNSLDENRSVSVSLPGFATFGTQRFLPQPRDSKIFQAFDAFSFELGSTGKVRMKIGAEYDRFHIAGSLPNFFAGLYRFQSLPAIPALGIPAPGINALQAFQRGLPAVFIQSFGDPYDEDTAQQVGAFIQSDVNVSSTFLLRLGVRYDYEKPIDPFPADSNNISPRVSFSWGPSDTVRVKGGYGRFYGVGAVGPMFAVKIQDGIDVRTKIRVFNQPATRPDLWPGCGFSPALAGKCPWDLPDRRFATEAAAGSVVPPFLLRRGEFESAYTDQANIGAEFSVSNKLLASADAVWAQGNNILIARNVNPITNVNPVTGAPQAGARPNPLASDTFQYESTGHSWYYAGTFGLITRIGGPFEASVYYTYAKSEDDYIDWLTDTQPQEPLFQGHERAPSVQTPDQKLSITGVYSTVGRGGSVFARDWTFSTILDWRNGLHYNILAGFDRNNNGDAASDRPVGVGRNAGNLGSQFSLDLRIARTIPFSSSVSAELIGVCTNVTDSENVVQRNAITNLTPTVANPAFGAPTLYGPGRIFQLGARILF